MTSGDAIALSDGEVCVVPYHPLENLESDMLTSVHGTLVCPVLFLDLVAYSKKSIVEQTLAKRWLNAALLTATRDVGPTDRIILDAGDGVALNFLRDAECA